MKTREKIGRAIEIFRLHFRARFPDQSFCDKVTAVHLGRSTCRAMSGWGDQSTVIPDMGSADASEGRRGSDDDEREGDIQLFRLQFRANFPDQNVCTISIRYPDQIVGSADAPEGRRGSDDDDGVEDVDDRHQRRDHHYRKRQLN